MQVRKRNGDTEPVDVNKIVRAVERCAGGLDDVDPMRVATKTISGLYDGATTAELDRLSIQTAAEMTGEEPQYSRLAARLLAAYIDKEVRGQGIASFSQSVSLGHAEGLIGTRPRSSSRTTPASWTTRSTSGGPAVRVLRHQDRLRPLPAAPPVHPAGDRDAAVLPAAGRLRAVPDPGRGDRVLPADVGAGLPAQLADAVQLRDQAPADVLVLPGRLAARRPGLDLRRYAQVARLSKFSGGIGIAWSRVRSRGALIRGTNGQSNGIVPWLRTLDASVAAVNQGGRRKGAACVYLEPWHPDIEEFLELRDNTGEDARRTHNLNLANWIPDEFMRRVEADEMWSLIDPDEVPGLPDLWGEAFDAAYRPAEADGRYVRQVKARDLYGKMMRTLAQTGNGWMTFKDASNAKCNQTGRRGTWCTCPTCARRSPRCPPTPRPRSATSARSTWPGT
jgi:ribonucleoside-diphosphate reductase alpha chain